MSFPSKLVADFLLQFTHTQTDSHFFLILIRFVVYAAQRATRYQIFTIVVASMMGHIICAQLTSPMRGNLS